MSEDHRKIGGQDEPADEVEGHGKLDRPGRPGVADDGGDEVEAHGRLDGKLDSKVEGKLD
jgi:hypothetical protein